MFLMKFLKTGRYSEPVDRSIVFLLILSIAAALVQPDTRLISVNGFAVNSTSPVCKLPAHLTCEGLTVCAEL